MKKFSLLVSVFLLSACAGDVKENLGLKKPMPDEFAVEKKPRLEVPPRFKIRPPRPGEKPINAPEVREVVRSQIIGIDNQTDAIGGEASLLQKMQVSAANPEIREILIDEYGIEDPTVLERIRTISDDNAAQILVDPVAERERLSHNRQQGKPINEGEVKTKTPDVGSSIIDKIIGE